MHLLATWSCCCCRCLTTVTNKEKKITWKLIGYWSRKELHDFRLWWTRHPCHESLIEPWQFFLMGWYLEINWTLSRTRFLMDVQEQIDVYLFLTWNPDASWIYEYISGKNIVNASLKFHTSIHARSFSMIQIIWFKLKTNSIE